MNRLAGETSPYLRQHRDNPVDWHPWGDEAFAAARTADKPLLLSVGYSACHWCHVMAHESFEDPATAAVLNELFVPVKVDREERPDVDAVYMEAVQAITGQGGWPMTVFLTPDGRPFFGGTYFPKSAMPGHPAFVDLLRAVAEAWHERRDQVEAQGAQLAEAIAARATLGEGRNGEDARDRSLGPHLLEAGYAALRAGFDAEWGGFGRAPKFPQATYVELALRAWAHNRSDDTLGMVTTTLDAMASGGIYDHLGGGFARYSVDAFWMVPHFEKMLYDQASLARLYLHGWQATGAERWRQVLEETVTYVQRDLAQPEGGVASAEDADSEGEEGKFYVWRQPEVIDVLGGPEPAAEPLRWYGVTKSGNFDGANILHRPERGDLLRPPAVEAARQRLFEARERRVRPGLDDKVLTEWNAMWLSVLAEAGAASGRDDWLAAAAALAEFLLAHLRDDTGRWRRSWQRDAGEARHLAYAADHAWLVDAFSRLYEATGRRRWLDEARDAADRLLELFGDDDAGGFFTTGIDAERLIVRQKDLFDGATPSANSTAANALLRLGGLTGEARYTDAGTATLHLLADLMAHHPSAFTHALEAVDFVVSGGTEVVVTGDRPDLVAAVASRYLPNAVRAWGERVDSPLWHDRPDDGRAYVCRNYVCMAPVDDVDAVLEQLGAVA